MSTWTHVAGIARIDEMTGILTRINPEPWIREAFSRHIPHGSEGPLQIQTLQTRTMNDLCWGWVAFGGDLRDFYSPEPIFDWLKEIRLTLWRNQACFRSLICKVEVEYSGGWIITDFGESVGDLPPELKMVEL